MYLVQCNHLSIGEGELSQWTSNQRINNFFILKEKNLEVPFLFSWNSDSTDCAMMKSDTGVGPVLLLSQADVCVDFLRSFEK